MNATSHNQSDWTILARILSGCSAVPLLLILGLYPLLGQEVPVGKNPYGVVFDGVNVWVSNQASNTISKLRASDGATVGTYPVGVSPQGIAFDGNDIWVANYIDNNITRLRASDGANQGTVPVGINPVGVAFDGTNIWVTNSFDGTISKIRGHDGALLGTFPVSNPVNFNALPMGVMFDGTSIWVANAAPGTVGKIRPSDGTILQTIQLGSGGLCGSPGRPLCPIPYGLAFDGSAVWVTEKGNNSLAKIQASDGTVLGVFSSGPGGGPMGIAFDGSNLWVVNNSGNNITQLRASDSTILKTVTVGATPIGIVFAAGALWVTNALANTVTRVSTITTGPVLFLQSRQMNGVSSWFMGGPNNAGIQSAPWFATAAAGWELLAVADMNGDGVLDLIFQNPSTGGVGIWFMTGANGLTIGSAPIIFTAAANWRVVTAVDMNSDGVADLIFQNSVTNQISIWFMKPGGLAFSSAPIIATSAPGWKLVTAADINQDGTPDLVLQNEITGQISVWMMNSGGLSYSSTAIVASPAIGWTLIAATDFNGDGTPDYIFQNRATGAVSVWYMAGKEGKTCSSAPVIATAAVGWSVVAVH